VSVRAHAELSRCWNPTCWTVWFTKV